MHLVMNCAQRFLMLILAPCAIALYVIPLIFLGVLSDVIRAPFAWWHIRTMRLKSGRVVRLTKLRHEHYLDGPWFERLGQRLQRVGRDVIVWNRETDRADGVEKQVYLHRHYVTGRRLAGLFSVCLHHFRLSDEDWLHDHPWPYVTIILSGGYWEHLASGERRWRGPGSVLFRSSRSAHMVELDPSRGPVWTLFIMGPRNRPREWGFRTARGWVHWDQYLNLRDRLGLRPFRPGAPGLPRPT